MAETVIPESYKPAVGDGIVVHSKCELPEGLYRVIAHSEFYGRSITIKQLPTKENNERYVRRKDLGLHDITQSRLATLIDDGIAAYIGIIDPVHRLRLGNELKGVRSKIYEERLPVLRSMVEPDTLFKLLGKQRSRTLATLARQFTISTKKLLRLFERLLDFGLDCQAAAMTAHDRCGRKARKDYARKQGRPRRHVANGRAPELCGINTDHQTLRAIEVFALTRHREDLTIQGNFRDFKTIHSPQRAHQLVDGTVVREEVPDEQFISYEQFRYHLKKFQSSHQEALNQKIKPIAGIREVRLALGNARERIVAPGYRLIIDSTLADVYLVCSWNRSRIIGRPVVYVVIDASTSTIVGLHVTLHSPSATQAKHALYRALTNKSAWLSRFGLHKYLHLLPAAPLPYELVYDRGELHSLEGEEIRAALGIGAGVPAPFFAEWKAIVERTFKTSNDYLIHWLPGSTHGRQRVRGEHDVRLDAVLTLHEFTQLMLHNVLRWNLRGKIAAKIHPQALIDDTAPSPVGLFDWGLRNLHGSPRYIEVAKATRALLESKPFSVGDRGIFCDNLRWTAPWMQTDYLALAAQRDRAGLLFQHPDAPSAALVQLADEQHFRQVELAAGWPVGDDYFPEDIIDYVVYESDHKNIHAEKTVRFETTLNQASLAVVKDAKRQTKLAHEASPQSKSKQVAEIRSNRADEIAAEKAITVPSRVIPPQAPSVTTRKSPTTQIGNIDLLQFVKTLK